MPCVAVTVKVDVIRELAGGSKNLGQRFFGQSRKLGGRRSSWGTSSTAPTASARMRARRPYYRTRRVPPTGQKFSSADFATWYGHMFQPKCSSQKRELRRHHPQKGGARAFRRFDCFLRNRFSDNHAQAGSPPFSDNSELLPVSGTRTLFDEG